MNFLNRLAGGGEEGGSASVGGWLSTLQEKAKEIGEVYKRDLGEFATTVKKDADELIHEVAEGSEAIIKSSSGAARLVVAGGETQANRPPTVSKLAALQQSSVTYTVDPSDKEGFKLFCNDFDAESKTSEISQVLKENEAVEALHKNLVPEQVSYKLFWCRYFFRLEALQEEDRKKNLLLSASDNLFGDQDDLTWDDEPESTAEPQAASSHHNAPPPPDVAQPVVPISTAETPDAPLATGDASTIGKISSKEKPPSPPADGEALLRRVAPKAEPGTGEEKDEGGKEPATASSSSGDEVLAKAEEQAGCISPESAPSGGASGGDYSESSGVELVGAQAEKGKERRTVEISATVSRDVSSFGESENTQSSASSSTVMVSAQTSASASLMASMVSPDNSSSSSASSSSAAPVAPTETSAAAENPSGGPEAERSEEGPVPSTDKADNAKVDNAKADDDWDDWE